VPVYSGVDDVILVSNFTRSPPLVGWSAVLLSPGPGFEEISKIALLAVHRCWLVDVAGRSMEQTVSLPPLLPLLPLLLVVVVEVVVV